MKLNHRNKRFTSSLLSLLTISGLISFPQYIKAEDVCALQGLANNDVAQQICTETCEKVNQNWYGVWLGKTDKKCPALKVDVPNIYGSVCNCVPYKCANIHIDYQVKTLPPYYASLDYYDCGGNHITKDAVAHPGQPNNFLAKVGTKASVGPRWTNIGYTTVTVPEKGVNIECYAYKDGKVSWGCEQTVAPLPVPALPIKPPHK